MTTAILRDYSPHDFERLHAIDQAAFPPELAYSRAELATYLALPGAHTLVAEAGGEVAGFVLGLRRRREGHVVTLDVMPRRQREGLGGRLLAAIEAWMWAGGARRISLETLAGEEGARAFYEKHGYAVKRRLRGYYDGTLDAWSMVKRRPAGNPMRC